MVSLHPRQVAGCGYSRPYTPDRLMTMPTKGTTKRNIRIDDDLWQSVQTRAYELDTSVAEVVRDLLREWLDQTTPKGR